MEITYIGHSGFIVQDDTCAFVIDCLKLAKDSAEIVKLAGKYLYILASHVHGDHFDPGIMRLGDGRTSGRTSGRTKWIFSKDIGAAASAGGADVSFLSKGDVYQDERVLVKAYGSTDEGVSFYIEAGGKKIFHAGDLNNWHWNEEETPEDADKNERFFLSELDFLAKEVPRLDAAMFPVDPRLGKDYMRGAQQFLDKIKTGLFIPMHFWDSSEAALAFEPHAAGHGSRFAAIHSPGDTFTV
ncbi:MAG: MBL fold metallo-hydrolase [Spirochaetes bacterium]|nr:MBL fold metallo-hydrolase [Spirochaetota bacterium]